MNKIIQNYIDGLSDIRDSIIRAGEDYSDSDDILTHLQTLQSIIDDMECGDLCLQFSKPVADK